MTTTVSVLLPSRGRPESLRESVESLRALADRPDWIEILVAADPDDAVTDLVAQQLGLPCWIAPERYGYARLNEYFNALAGMAGGDWVLLWNDDARMLTVGWDVEIARQSVRSDKQVVVCDLWVDGHSPHLCAFPAVWRPAIKPTCEVFSPVTCHCDTWWQDIGRATGTISPVDIRVDHQRADLTGKHHDATYLEGQAGYRSHEFYGPVVQGAMHSAITRLRRYLGATT